MTSPTHKLDPNCFPDLERSTFSTLEVQSRNAGRQKNVTTRLVCTAGFGVSVKRHKMSLLLLLIFFFSIKL